MPSKVHYLELGGSPLTIHKLVRCVYILILIAFSMEHADDHLLAVFSIYS